MVKFNIKELEKVNIKWSEGSQVDNYLPRPGDIVPCLLCGKPFIMPRYYGVADQVCGPCCKTYKETATLLCRRCNVVIARVSPAMLDCGFYIRPQSVLHLDKCSLCDPTLNISTIIEIDNWMKTHYTPRIILPGQK